MTSPPPPRTRAGSKSYGVGPHEAHFLDPSTVCRPGQRRQSGPTHPKSGIRTGQMSVLVGRSRWGSWQNPDGPPPGKKLHHSFFYPRAGEVVPGMPATWARRVGPPACHRGSPSLNVAVQYSTCGAHNRPPHVDHGGDESRPKEQAAAFYLLNPRWQDGLSLFHPSIIFIFKC